MKISQQQLKKIIQEELQKELEEQLVDEEQVDEIFGKIGGTARKIAQRFQKKPAQPAQADTPPPAVAQQAAKPAAPKVISVEKGKNSLQNQLVSKYGGQLGPQANKALALIARNIKAELSANGIQVQESEKVIHGYLLKEINESVIGQLGKLGRAKDELKNIQNKKISIDYPELEKKRDIRDKEAEIKELEVQYQQAQQQYKDNQAKKEIDAQAAQKPAEQPAAQEQPKAPETASAAAPAEQPAAKPAQTPTPSAAVKPTPEKAKHVPKAGQVNIARVVNDGLKQALGDLNDPKNQAVLKTLSPQIINLVTKFVNYAVNSSGKQGQVKIIGMHYGKQPAPAAGKPATKPAAPAQQPASVGESYKATYNKWQKIIKG